MVLLCGTAVVALCFGMVAVLGKMYGAAETMDEIEARERRDAEETASIAKTIP